MSLSDWSTIYTYAEKWIKEAGEIIKSTFSKEISVEFKSNPTDLVTDVDRDTEQYFAKKIKKAFPKHYILGEEGFGDDIKDASGTIWVVDPIDGTTNFVHQKRHFTISIAVYHDGVGQIGLIYDVVSEDLYHCIKGQGAYLNGEKLRCLENKEVAKSLIGINASWVTENERIDPTILSPIIGKCRGTRSYGSAALEMAYVASGILDAYITLRLSPWDFAAGKLLVEEVGGICTSVDGGKIDFLSKTSIMVANPQLQHQLLNDFILKDK